MKFQRTFQSTRPGERLRPQKAAVKEISQFGQTARPLSAHHILPQLRKQRKYRRQQRGVPKRPQPAAGGSSPQRGATGPERHQQSREGGTGGAAPHTSPARRHRRERAERPRSPGQAEGPPRRRRAGRRSPRCGRPDSPSGVSGGLRLEPAERARRARQPPPGQSSGAAPPGASRARPAFPQPHLKPQNTAVASPAPQTPEGTSQGQEELTGGQGNAENPSDVIAELQSSQTQIVRRKAERGATPPSLAQTKSAAFKRTPAAAQPKEGTILINREPSELLGTSLELGGLPRAQKSGAGLCRLRGLRRQ